MKKLLCTLLLIGAFSANAAVNLMCDGPMRSRDRDSSGVHNFVAGSIYNDCEDSYGNNYSIIMSGVGPGLEFASGGFVVSCPSVSKKRLDSRGKIVLGAVNASASVLVGVNTGIAINHRGGACIIFGIHAGIGASIKIGALKLMRGTLKRNGIENLW